MTNTTAPSTPLTRPPAMMYSPRPRATWALTDGASVTSASTPRSAAFSATSPAQRTRRRPVAGVDEQSIDCIRGFLPAADSRGSVERGVPPPQDLSGAGAGRMRRGRSILVAALRWHHADRQHDHEQNEDDE